MLEYEIQGGKGGESKPHTPVETPNNLLSVAIAKVLIAVAEGELAGRPTAQDIFLDGTPLANADGSLNFQGVKWEWRSGTSDQDFIPGVPEVTNEFNIGVELRDNSPWTRLFTKTALDAIRVTFQWPALMEQATNGDTNGYTMKYAIDLSTNGGPFVQYQEYEISGKTNNAYERTHKITLPESTSGWTVRARRVTPESTSGRIQDTINIKSCTEVMDYKQRYPNTALLYVEFDSRTFGSGSIPKVSVKTKGRIVQVPSNYNPITRTYTGVWDGSFKWEWTDNPAWVYYDLVTQNRFGLGHKVDASMVDSIALYEVAQYCDVLVDDGTGSGNKKPRHTCNVYIQEQSDAYQVLRDIATIFNGMTYWNGNQFVAIADKQEPLDNLPIFSRSNVVGGVFDYQAADDKSLYTSALVSYDDPANHYGTQVEGVWEQSEILRWGGERKVEISAIGCTDRGEAQRKARYTLLTNMANRTVKFQTGLQGLNDAILPGKLINVLDPLIGGREYTGRIIVATGRVITLDRPLEGGRAGDLLFLTKKDGTSEARTIQSVNGAVVSVTVAYSEQILPNAVWYHEAQDLKSQIFRVTKITNPSPGAFEIEGVEYNDSKYNAIDTGARLETRPVSIVPPGVMAPPESVTITSHTYVEQTMAVSVMTVAWPQVPNAVHYEGQWRVGSSDWVELGSTGALEFNVKGIYTGKYVARVRAVNAVGVKSVWRTSVLTDLDGKKGTPPTLAYLQTTPLLWGIALNWGFPEGAEDTLRTEVMYSQNSSFDAAIKLGDFSYPTDKHEMHGLKAGQTFWFWARLVDRTGNIGPWYPASSGAGVVGQSALNDNGQYNDILAGMISETALDKTLYDRIELIDGYGPGSVNSRIESIRVEVGDVSDRVETVNGRVDQALLEVDEVRDSVDDYKTSNGLVIDQIKEDVKTANTKIDEVNSTLGGRITEVDTKVDTNTNYLNGRIDDANTTISNSVNDLQHQIDNIQDALEYDPTKTYQMGDIVRKGSNLYQAIVNVPINSPPPNEALWRDIGSLLETNVNLVIQVDKNTSDILNLDGKVTSNVTRLEMMTAAWREDGGEGQLVDAITGWTNEATIATEKITRANEDEALSQRITTITARVSDNEAKINTVEQAIATQESAMAQVASEIRANTLAAHTRITELSKVVATNDKATTERLTSAESKISNNTATISTLETTVATNDSAQTKRVDEIKSQVDTNTSAITQIIETSTSNNEALVEMITQVDVKVGNNSTKITDLTTVVADEKTSTAERFTQINTTVGKNTADITELTRTVVDGDKALSERLDQMGTVVDDNKTRISTLERTVSDGNNAIAERIDELETTVGENTANITTIEKAQAGLESTVASITNNLSAVFTAQRDDDGEGELDAALKAQTAEANFLSETKVRASADEAMTQRIEVLSSELDGNKASISDVMQTVATLDSATASRLQEIQAVVGTNISQITDLSKVVSTNESSTAQRFTSIQSAVDGNKSAIETLSTTTSTANDALARRIDSVQTEVGQNSSAITGLQTTFSDFEGTYAEDIRLVTSKIDKEVDDRVASVGSEATTRADADRALGIRIDSTDSKVGENAAGIQRVEEAQTELDSAVAKLTTNLSAIVTPRPDDGEGELDAALRDWTSEATFAQEVKTLANQTESEALRITQMEATFGSELNRTNAAITEEQLVRASGDEAVAQSVTKLRVDMGTETSKLSAAITEESNIRVREGEAIAQRFTSLTATVDDNTANIKREEEARVEGDKVVARRIEEVAASAITGDDADIRINARVRTEELARIDADGALGRRIDQVSADFTTESGTIYAAITDERTARVNADEAIVDRIEILEAVTPIGETEVKALIKVETDARVSSEGAITRRIEQQDLIIGDHTSSIQQQTSQISNMNGKITQSWTLKMEQNSNGQYVAAGIGLGIENGPAGLQSQFLVRADRFAVVNGTNATTTAPFVVQGGQVFINEALINKAMITTAIIGSTLQSSTQSQWNGGPIMTIDFNTGNVITRHLTRANTYSVMDRNGMYVVIDGVMRVRMGTW